MHVRQSLPVRCTSSPLAKIHNSFILYFLYFQLLIFTCMTPLLSIPGDEPVWSLHAYLPVERFIILRFLY